eukprot:5430654-Prymnesium_polylepis.1
MDEKSKKMPKSAPSTLASSLSFAWLSPPPLIKFARSAMYHSMHGGEHFAQQATVRVRVCLVAPRVRGDHEGLKAHELCVFSRVAPTQEFVPFRE